MSTSADQSTPARQLPADAGSAFDLTPTDEQRLLTDAVSDFASSRIRPAAGDADRAARTPDELLAQAAELGLSGIGVPEELGGALGVRATMTAALAAEALARGDMGIALACLAPAGVATALGLWGDAAQQATHLPGFLADAPTVAAIALLEPQPLFDPFAPRTRARANPGGGYTLDGVKALVPGALAAELLLVGAELDGSPALFIVDADRPGVGATAAPAMGLRGAATGTLRFEQVQLPASALLAESDPRAYAEVVALGRLGWCALTVGTGQAVLDYVSAYVNERQAFGEPISNRQSVAFAVADMAIELDGLRLATQRAADLAQSGRPFMREVALARALADRHGMRIGSDGVQLLGGHGYTREHPVERWYRDLRAAAVMEGALAL